MIVEITGLRKNDPIIRLMYASFDAVRSFISTDVATVSDSVAPDLGGELAQDFTSNTKDTIGAHLGLSYQINIILPETENVAVFNAIFKSLRENLLR